ncbi:dTMP kinase [Streptomyces sp. H27-C3]|uniref:dTMP kinase n=1 Tax=Streptomyces sp. H27-C3 TaxID=3046305 RepID=UPI0024BB0C24|nr:dTMP kinase [Streptomyces sp. H27-C3]MDJ0460426.1 dTMP kinase [Streptomyces sp. H27-C3]
MTGRFVTLDGPGGVGKSTAARLLSDLLRQRGDAVHATTEPSRSELGAFTRSHADQITGRSLACLVAADRYDHLAREIEPQLDQGVTVVCDRYLASTLVVQQLDGVDEDFLLALNAGVRLPDLSVILTADPAVITARLFDRGAHHRFERDPGIPQREVALYKRAAVTLIGLGVSVLVVNTSTVPSSGVAARIAESLATSSGSVAPRPHPAPLTE